jgi:hypothetical protein
LTSCKPVSFSRRILLHGVSYYYYYYYYYLFGVMLPLATFNVHTFKCSTYVYSMQEEFLNTVIYNLEYAYPQGHEPGHLGVREKKM